MRSPTSARNLAIRTWVLKNLLNLCALLCKQGRLLGHRKRQCAEEKETNRLDNDNDTLREGRPGLTCKSVGVMTPLKKNMLR